MFLLKIYGAFLVLLALCGGVSSQAVTCSVLANGEFLRPGLNETTAGPSRDRNDSNFITGTGSRTLICIVTVNGSDSTAPSLQWNRNGGALTIPDGAEACSASVSQYATVKNIGAGRWNASLVFCSTARSNAGVYNLVRNGSATVASVHLYAAPTLTTSPVNKDYSFGENIAVHCVVTGYPMPNITWLRVGQPIVKAPRYNFTQMVTSGKAGVLTTVQGTMHINNGQYEDRNKGAFTCTASSALPSYASDQASVTSPPFLVRVRDPLGALWPFLGILVQGLILLAFLHYDKRQRLAKNMVFKPNMGYSSSDADIAEASKLNKHSSGTRPTAVSETDGLSARRESASETKVAV